MAHRYKLGKETLRLLEAAREAVEAARVAVEEERDEHRDVWENATERYQESERGEAANEWIDALDEFTGECETFEGLFEDLAEEPAYD